MMNKEFCDAIRRLQAAADALIKRLVDSGEFGPDDPVGEEVWCIRDAQNQLWYPDVWELRESASGMEGWDLDE